MRTRLFFGRVLSSALIEHFGCTFYYYSVALSVALSQMRIAARVTPPKRKGAPERCYPSE